MSLNFRMDPMPGYGIDSADLILTETGQNKKRLP
jgi:hypothetical protein